MAPAGLEIYEKVKAQMATGMNTSQACEAVGTELGRSRQSIATTYYRWARKDPSAPVSKGRGRPRKSGAPRAARVAPAAGDPLAAVSAEITALREENARLRAMIDAVRAAVK